MTLRPNDLHRPGSAVPLVPYLKSMWSFRRYAVALAKARVESTNAETALGRVWLLGEPLLFIAVYGTIFGLILDADRGVENFIGFLAAGQILYRHNSQSLQQAASSIRTFEAQIQTMPVPRILFPITSVLSTFFNQVPAFGVMLVLLVATGERPSLAWLFIVPIIGGQFLLNLGLGAILARAVAHLPDFANILTHVFRALLYASGVVFPIRAFVEERENGELFLSLLTIFNPIYAYLELGRWALMDISPGSAGLVILSASCWSIGSLIVGVLWLRRVELRFGFGQIRNAP